MEMFLFLDTLKNFTPMKSENSSKLNDVIIVANIFGTPTAWKYNPSKTDQLTFAIGCDAPARLLNLFIDILLSYGNCVLSVCAYCCGVQYIMANLHGHICIATSMSSL